MPLGPVPFAPALPGRSSTPLGPTPFTPLLPGPPLPLGPLGRGLAGAYGAVEAARASDPAAAQQAAGLYLQAQLQARNGDVSGALATAAAARAAAVMALPATRLTPAIPLAAPRVPASGIPLVGGTGFLPTELLRARDAIARAELMRHGSALAQAKERYRSALDAYFSGDAARAARDARAALDLANRSGRKDK